MNTAKSVRYHTSVNSLLSFMALHKNSKKRICESSIVNRQSKYRLFDKVVERFLLTIND
jgi:hypothetical protein